MDTGERDVAGMTLTEVVTLSLEERFDLVGEREMRVRQLMTPAQEHISTGTWIWGSGAIAFPRGASPFDLLSGATSEESYHLEMSRILPVEGEPGGQQDAEKMALYFESQGWETERSYVPDDLDLGYSRYEVEAHTADGYRLQYRVQSTGFNNLTILSGTFWAGDYRELQEEVMYRIPRDGFFPENEESIPGEYVPFPKWSDPKLWEVE